MNSQELRSLQEAYLRVYELDENLLRSLDTGARNLAGTVGGNIGARKGREQMGNLPILGDIGARQGRTQGTQRGHQMYDKAKETVGGLLKQDYELDLFDIILEHLLDEGYADTNESAIAIMGNMSQEWRLSIVEALKPSVVKAAARQQYTSKSVMQRVGGGRSSGSSPGSIATKPQPTNTGRTAAGGSRGSTPQNLKFTKVYHGTTKPASQAISKGGWRTDTNVTRQMQGSGVYTTPQKPAAQMYAKQRANQRGENPAVRTFNLPTDKFNTVKANRQKAGTWTANKGGNKFNVMQMSPQGANKYDITDKPKSAVDLKNTQRRELRQRVNTALSKPQNRAALSRDIKGAKPKPMRTIRGGGSSAQGVGSPSGTTGRFQVGGGQGYGISNIKLAT